MRSVIMEGSGQRSVDPLTHLAKTQRHIAALIARGVPLADVFGTVAAKLGQLIGTDGANMVRFEDDGTAAVVAAWGWGSLIPVGTNLSLEGRSVSAMVRDTGRPARIDNYGGVPRPLAAR